MSVRTSTFDKVVSVKSKSKFSADVTFSQSPKLKEIDSNLTTNLSKTKRIRGYDTVDSAYSTSESSYNTVDSSFSQQSANSDYDTLELRWKDTRYCQQNRDSHEKSLLLSSTLTLSGPTIDRLRYVDDSDTETEADVGLSKPNSDEMSYVPYYVRPVPSQPSSSVAITNTNSDPLYTTIVTKPVTLSTTSSMLAAAPQINYSKSPLMYNRIDRNSSYAGYREDYIRKQKDKLCGRKSLDDRLKSLESGASVKLQVCKGSQNRRKKPIEKYTAPSVETNPNNEATDEPFQIGNSPKEIFKNNKEDEQIEFTFSKPPQPDIIESHQPPNYIELNSHFSCDKPSIAIVYDKTDIKDQFQDKVNDRSISSDKLKKEYPDSDDCDYVTESKELSPERGTLFISTSPSKEVSSHKLSPVNDQRSSRLKWRQPSQEALNKLHASLPKLSPSLDSESEKYRTSFQDDDDVTPKASVDDPSLVSEEETTPLVVDVTMDNLIVPVELRSPRHVGESRLANKEKRNARVFTFPAAEESNLEKTSKATEEESQSQIAPVKFIPSLLLRNHKSGGGDVIPPISALTNSVKATISQQNQPPAKELTKTLHVDSNFKSKSSQPAKRSSSTKRTCRSKSNHDHGNNILNKSSRSRRRSSGSQSPTPVSASSISRTYTQSSNHSPKAASSHKNHKSRGRRPKTEYAELTDLRRPSLHHSKRTSNPPLPSPRQQAVAQAIVGLPGSEGEFPYIDDTGTSPEEQLSTERGKEKSPPSDSRERCSSDGALLRDVSLATVRRAFPLSPRGQSIHNKDAPRRTSYMEAMESSEDLTPDPDSDVAMHVLHRSPSSKEENISYGILGRSTSADSILSSNVEKPQKVLVRRRDRASSADRGALKKSHRRSYQIATNKPTDVGLLRQPHKRQASIRRLKSFFENPQPSADSNQTNNTRRRSRGRSLDVLPAVVLSDSDGEVAREGSLSFKVATIDKGKRTSAQKSWKSIWAVLKGQLLYLCKDLSRSAKSEPVSNEGGATGDQDVSLVTIQPPLPPSPVQLVLEEEVPLNIQASLVTIAYNYVKRKNVFRLTTCNGSEYLFQAEDRDDMLAWIDAIHNCGNRDDKKGELINKDLILKKSSQIELGPKPEKRNNRKGRSPKPSRNLGVTVKDVDGSRRFKWRGSVNRIVKKFGQGQVMVPGGTFDVHLEDCPSSIDNELIPFVVDLCCRIVEDRGLNFTGIYRVPGNSGTLSTLQEELNNRGPEGVDIENDPRFRELNVVSSLLKSFFRKLPDPLFTNELYDDFITINRKKDSDERLNGLRRLIHMLPAPHYETLKFLVAHLRKVADHSDVNKMEIRNLAIVFGPTLVRSTISDNMTTMVTDMSDQCRIVESVLQHANWFFSDENEVLPAEEQPPVPKEEDHEPVPSIDHLLANVGRTPGDALDYTSDSSKSKTSNASEKDSFSRDVFDIIFGAGKRFLSNPQRNDKTTEQLTSSDDEYGFKEAEKRQAAGSKVASKSPPSSPTPQRYQVSKPAASGIRAAWPNKVRPTPVDVSTRLYNYYFENIERAQRTNLNRPKPNNLTSSADISQMRTSRTLFYHPPEVQRTYAMQSCVTKPPVSRGISVPFDPPSPLANRTNSIFPEKQTRIFKSTEDIQSNTHTDVNSKPDDGSDSDTSVYVGETLEEKLKNLTNLEKKLERRPSRRNRPNMILKIAPPADVNIPAASNKRFTAPSLLAGEVVTPNNLLFHANKKTTHDLYRERKAQRQYHRDLVKARRVESSEAINRACSIENVFKRSDPKRQLLRPCAVQDESVQSNRLHPTGEKVRRRHTLGGSDFPGREFYEARYNSLQDVTQEDPNSAMARLRPKYGSSTPFQLSSKRITASNGTVKATKIETLKKESYL